MAVATTGNVMSDERRFVWQIKNFSLIGVSTGAPLYSPIFFTANPDGKTLHWQLQLYLDNGKDYISIFIMNMNRFGVALECKLSIIDDENKDVFKHSYKSDANVETIQPMQLRGWPNFAKRASIRDAKNRTLLNDTLSVSCCIFSATSSLDSHGIEKDGTTASKYKRSLFENGSFSDITFSVEDKEMRLHKVIVASMSTVFQEIFENDIEENLVVVTGVKYDIMKELFNYIYTRRVNNIDGIADDLLVAADGYAVAGLKMMCEVSLASTLSEDNGLQRLHLAVTCNTTHLKPRAVEFVTDNLRMLLGKAEFRELNYACKDEILNALANGGK